MIERRNLKIKDPLKVLVFFSLFVGVIFLYWNLVREAVVLISGSIIYLLISKRNHFTEVTALPKFLVRSSTHILLDMLFFSSLSVLIFGIVFSKPYTLPINFFILSIAMSCFLVVDIFSAEKKNRIKIVLIKIILLSLFLRLAPLYKFPYTGTDILYHSYVVDGIVKEAHNFLPEWAMYSNYLGMHYIVVATDIVTGLSIANSMKIIVFLEVLGIIFLFLVGKSIFNEKIGLLSAFIIGIDYQHINWGLNIIPMSLALTLVVMLIYLLIKFSISGKIAFKALTLAMMLVLIYTHTLSSLIFFILLSAMYFGNKLFLFIFNKEEVVRSSKFPMPIFFVVAMISYWIYSSKILFDFVKLLKYAFSTDLSQFTLTIPSETPVLDIYMLMDISYIFFVTLVIIGTFYCLKYKRDINSHMLITGGVVIALIINLSQHSRLYTDAILPDRWWAFIYITIAPLSALGILLMFNAIRRNSIRFSIIIFIIIVITSSNMFTAFVVPDNPVFKPDRATSLNDFEVSIAATFLRNYEGAIVSDETYNWYITNIHGNKVEDLYRYIRSGDLGDVDGVVLIRDFIFYHPIVFSYEKKEGGYAGGSIRLNTSQINMIRGMEDQYINIYDNGKVEAYSNVRGN